ncbi:MAG: LCP family protein [Actinomycetia bacterium]|nr:LCP family protein [Actinomycetes bacterium]
MAPVKKPLSKSYSRPAEVNLISARSAAYGDAAALSRDFSADNYARQRARRSRAKTIRTVIMVVFLAAVVAFCGALAVYKLILEPRWNDAMHMDASGNVTDFSSGVYEGIYTPPVDNSPFYVLLLGLEDYQTNDVGRTDTIILVRVDPGKKQIAMISIPRDLRVSIPGNGSNKINSAYTWGEIQHTNFTLGHASTDNSGVALAVQTVSQFAGVDIAYSVLVDFNGFKDLVNAMGGVTVDVPVRIDDPEAGDMVIEPGVQTLNGDQAMCFVRSRRFPNGDYQRQADQRTFLQALATQILSSDPATIVAAVDSLTQITHTNMTVNEIMGLATTFRGLQASDIHTYTVPATSQDIDGISYEVVQQSAWQSLIGQINAGNLPSTADAGLSDYHMGVTPDGYAVTNGSSDNGGILDGAQCAQFVVDVRNGWGIKGAATSVSDMLAMAGYQPGEVGNTASMVYQETLVIYQNDADRPAAEDIVARLGYGRVVQSSYYNFTGNILVVVGGDFPH